MVTIPVRISARERMMWPKTPISRPSTSTTTEAVSWDWENASGSGNGALNPIFGDP